MLDVFALLSDISPAIKIGWVVFAAWSAAQVMWFQRSRLAAATVKPTRKRKNQSSPRRSVARAPRQQPSADDNTELLTSLGFQTPGTTQYGVPMSSGQVGPNILS